MPERECLSWWKGAGIWFGLETVELLKREAIAPSGARAGLQSLLGSPLGAAAGASTTGETVCCDSFWWANGGLSGDWRGEAFPLSLGVMCSVCCLESVDLHCLQVLRHVPTTA